MNTNKNKKFYTVKDIAEFFSVKKHTVYKWAREGTIPKPDIVRTKPKKWLGESIQPLFDSPEKFFGGE